MFDTFLCPMNVAPAAGVAYTIQYPAGRNAASYAAGAPHELTIGQRVCRAPADFTITFGPTSFVITMVQTVPVKQVPVLARVVLYRVQPTAGAVGGGQVINTIDDIPDGVARVSVTRPQRSKLDSVETGAQRNPESLDDIPPGQAKVAVTPDFVQKVEAFPMDPLTVSQAGRPGGYAVLGADGKIPATQVGAVVKVVKAGWNAAINSPAVVGGAAGTYEVGDALIVSTAGTTEIDGTSTWNVGDMIVLTAGPPLKWVRVTGGGVVSVNGKVGVVLLTAADVSAAPSSHVGAGGTSVHPAATGSTAGFMAAADKTKLDALPSNAAANPATATDAEITAGTESNNRSISPRQMALAAATHAPAVAANTIGLDKLSDIASARFLGRATTGVGDPEVLTAAQARTILNVTEAEAQVSAGEKTAGTETGLRKFAPKDIADMALTHGGAAMADGSVTEAKLGAAAVTADKIGAGAVTADKLGAAAVTTAKIDTGAVTADKLGAGSVTAAKLATVATATIKGRVTAGTGAPEDLTAAQVRTLLNVADGAAALPAAVTAGEITAGTETAARTFSPKDVKDVVITHALASSDRVANSKLAQIATNTVKGRTASGTGDVQDLDRAALHALMNISAAELPLLQLTSPGQGSSSAFVPNAPKKDWSNVNLFHVDFSTIAKVKFASAFIVHSQDVWLCPIVTNDNGTTWYYLDGSLWTSSYIPTAANVGAVFLGTTAGSGSGSNHVVSAEVTVAALIRGFTNARVTYATFPAGPDGGAVRTSPTDYTPTNTLTMQVRNSRLLVTKGIPAAGTAGTINDLSDVDTGSVLPVTGQALIWNGTNWVAGSARATDEDVTLGTGTGARQFSPAQIKLAAETHGAGLADGAVVAAKIAEQAVGTVAIADAAVTSTKIADGAITTNKHGTGTVPAAALANDAVGTVAIANGAVTEPKIADAAVTAAKLAANAVTSAAIASGQVGAAAIATDAIVAAKIAAGAVTLAKLAPIGQNVFLARQSSGSGYPEALTSDQAMAALGLSTGLRARPTSEVMATGTSSAVAAFSVADVRTIAETFGGAGGGTVSLIPTSEVTVDAATAVTARGISGARLLEGLSYHSPLGAANATSFINAASNRWNGTGFRPGNTGAQNSAALEAIFAAARAAGGRVTVMFPGGTYDIAQTFSPSGQAQSTTADEETRADYMTLVAAGTVHLRASAAVTAYMKQRFWSNATTVVDAADRSAANTVVPWSALCDSHFIQAGGNLKDIRLLVNVRNAARLRFLGSWVFDGNGIATTDIKLACIGSSGGTVQTGAGTSGAYGGAIDHVVFTGATLGMIAGTWGMSDPGAGSANRRAVQTFEAFTIGTATFDGCDAAFVFNGHVDGMKWGNVTIRAAWRSYLAFVQPIVFGPMHAHLKAGVVTGPRHLIVFWKAMAVFEGVNFDADDDLSDGNFLLCHQTTIPSLPFFGQPSRKTSTGAWVRSGRAPSGETCIEVSAKLYPDVITAGASSAYDTGGAAATQSLGANSDATLNGTLAVDGAVTIPQRPEGGANHPGFDLRLSAGAFSGTVTVRCYHATLAGVTGSVDVVLASGSTVVVGQRAQRWTRIQNLTATQVNSFRADTMRGWNMTGTALEAGRAGAIAVEAVSAAIQQIEVDVPAGALYDPVKAWGQGNTRSRFLIRSMRNDAPFAGPTNYNRVYTLSSVGNLT